LKVMDRKEADDVTALVRAIEPAGRAGIELQMLIARVQLPSSRIERLLRRHSDYFVQIADQSRFALNRFRKFRGSAELIVADVEQSYQRFAKMQLVGTILLVTSVLLTCGSYLLFG